MYLTVLVLGIMFHTAVFVWCVVQMPKVAAKLDLTKRNYGLANCSNYQVGANVNIRGSVKRK